MQNDSNNSGSCQSKVKAGAGMRVRSGQVLAAAMVMVALAGCGSGGSSGGGGSQYTYWSNPCVTSRIANGDWQQNMVNYQIPLVGAAYYCSMGASFDDTADPRYYIGQNTSGWDWTGKIPGVPNDPLEATPPAYLDTPSATSHTSLSPLQVWWDGMRPLVVAISKAGTGMQCTTVTSGNALEANAAKALSYVENSSVPAAYDNITLALDRALTLYQAAGGFCAAAEPSLAASYFAQGSIYLKRALAAVQTDGGNPAGAGNPAGSSSPSPVASAAMPAYTPSTDPLSVGCPSSGQLLAAWDAAPASARHSWMTLTPTGFFGTECWRQWVVTNPVIQGNGSVVFTETGGRLSLLPEADLSELDAAICGVAGAPAVSWAGPGGPATCSQSG